ncbi:chorismate-binding protein [Comamonas sp. lk]|uniref:chorismate-binding protein n=1 Tax=Comamonas sp. lk TaxID=2201272 RepID=UPI000EAB756F|nr:chorismate-binding protein [Comamonas sp. lk]
MKSCIDFSDPHDPAAPRLRQQFGRPLRVLAAYACDEVPAVLQAVEQAAQQGLYCLGWLAYEAAAAFDPAYAGAVHAALPGQPLAWFGVHEQLQDWEASEPDQRSLPPLQWLHSPDRARFDADIARIHAAIAQGECYQINYTAPLIGRLCGPAGLDRSAAAQALFAVLQRAQPGGYAALVDSGDMQVLSVSPELFFDWNGERILTRPMKGTAARGDTPEADALQARTMRESPKERAENVMIVDLLRNDLSRIAVPHSVKVPRLFHTEALPSVWQMTSDVVAQTRPGTTLAQVFGALFPCGSITGAPKRQAMRLIQALEPQARGVYCGALGLVRPGTAPGRIHATFNVPIRTPVVHGDEIRCGIGSGITASATAAAEWQEWQHKQRFLDLLG